MLYGLALVGGMVEQLGVLLDNQVMQNMGIISSLLLPSDALWRMAAQRLDVQELAVLAGGGPFQGFSQPSAIMLVWTLLYISFAVLLGVRVFGRKDL